ncbi:hypothetical protein [Paenibacillus odorifer]|uniref:Phage ABA sandwich domain-containing protein n=1 Tax=Paenibacillus odorifer TaxID=189426 RepID=A0ABX3GBZ0_9BACL|nr:hypothetical protein [Paenibacillus odorifer]OMC92951.1 hypothetical protein BSO21_34245 [Paenibacillus odorifer]
MTQVKDKTDQQLNRALAELMGYKVRLKGSCYWLVNPTGEEYANPFGRNSEEIVWTWVPDYCTDPAASLEVQEKALELNYKAYIDHLDEFVNTDELTICSEPSYRAIASLLLASPRERAEAAYVTIQGEK